MTERAPRAGLVLVSACLLGEPVRHDGAHRRAVSPVLQRWQAQGRVVALCPEQAGGLPVPRPPAEIAEGAGGARVLDGLAHVVDVHGRDVTAAFVAGARATLALVEQHGICVAVLKEGSPSCGSGQIHDGRFIGQRVAAAGVTAALLARAGVRVFDEAQFTQAEAWLATLDDAWPARPGPR